MLLPDSSAEWLQDLDFRLGDHLRKQLKLVYVAVYIFCFYEYIMHIQCINFHILVIVITIVNDFFNCS